MEIELEVKAKVSQGKPKIHAFLKVTNTSVKKLKIEMYRIGMQPEMYVPTNNFFEVRAGEK